MNSYKSIYYNGLRIDIEPWMDAYRLKPMELLVYAYIYQEIEINQKYIVEAFGLKSANGTEIGKALVQLTKRGLFQRNKNPIEKGTKLYKPERQGERCYYYSCNPEFIIDM